MSPEMSMGEVVPGVIDHVQDSVFYAIHVAIECREHRRKEYGPSRYFGFEDQGHDLIDGQEAVGLSQLMVQRLFRLLPKLLNDVWGMFAAILPGEIAHRLFVLRLGLAVRLKMH